MTTFPQFPIDVNVGHGKYKTHIFFDTREVCWGLLAQQPGKTAGLSLETTTELSESHYTN